MFKINLAFDTMNAKPIINLYALAVTAEDFSR